MEDAIRAAGKGLSGIDRAVLRVLNSYANPEGLAWPSVTTIIWDGAP